MRYKISDDLIAAIQRHEGGHGTPYKDTRGIDTAGWGRNLRDNGLSVAEAIWIAPGDHELQESLIKDPVAALTSGGAVLTEATATRMLKNDISVAVDDCYILFGDAFDTFTQSRQDALVNMCFNMGRPVLSKFVNMRAAIGRDDWANAAYEAVNSRWYETVKGRGEEIVKMIRDGKSKFDNSHRAVWIP